MMTTATMAPSSTNVTHTPSAAFPPVDMPPPEARPTDPWLLVWGPRELDWSPSGLAVGAAVPGSMSGVDEDFRVAEPEDVGRTVAGTVTVAGNFEVGFAVTVHCL